MDVKISSLDSGHTWQIDTISYRASDVSITESNSIYFIDKNTQELKKLSWGGLQVLADSIQLYDINEDSGIVAVHYNMKTIEKSQDSGMTWVYLPPLYVSNVMIGPNSITHAKINFFKDTIIIYGTYPNVVVYSVDNGMSWTGNYVYTYPADILSSNKLIGVGGSVDSNQIQFTTDTGANWVNQGIINFHLNGFYFFNESLGFAFGDNGNILRTINGGGTVGIRENSNLKKKIRIYPNPAKGKIHLETRGEISITSLKLINSQGKEVRQYKKEKKDLDISNFPSGIYFLHIQSEEGEVMEKIVIQ